MAAAHAFAALCLAAALGAPGVPAAAPAARVRIPVTRLEGTLRIDGRLDEPDWQRATPLTDFRLIFVREGEAPSESTDVRVLVDDRRIYFGIRCGAHGRGGIRASLAPRDQILDDDLVTIQLDTYRDFHRAYVFGVNPYAVQFDGILDGGDVSADWDGVWDAEATRDSAGWSAEIAVPLRTMRFPSHGDGVWGLWIRRQITRNDEICSYPLWRQAEQGDIMLQAADLTGLEGLRGGGRLEIEPYAASQVTSQRGPGEPPGALTPWASSHDNETGGDVKLAITSTLVANATINPDYSQIEADALQIDVNQRYPLYYPEKRPFFLEGAETFTTPIDLVYTRRMADPAYGVRLVGKTGPWRLGLIGVRDDGGGSQDGIGWGSTDEPSRPGYVGVARATFDIGSKSSVGVLLTGRRTDGYAGAVPAGGPGAVSDGGGNAVAAADANLRLAQNLFFTGQLGASATRSDSLPYAGGTTSTHVTDGAYQAELKFADGTTEIEMLGSYLGPEFRAETGFLQQVDRRRAEMQADVMFRPQNAVLRTIQPIVDGYVLHDHTGTLQEWYASPMIDWEFQRQTHAHTMYVRKRERWFDQLYDQNRYILNLDNSYVRALALGFQSEVGDGIYYGATPAESYLGWTENYVATATARPSPRFTAELSATRNRFSREPWRSTVFDVWLLGAKCTYQFTRRLYARVYPQYDSGREHLDGDGLLGYVIHPGTVLYFGTNNGYDRIDGVTHATRRVYFFKASVLIQP
ncbi:MAG TPA: DUF5916 domain-containing protein [Candidatus Eisenbacteria bacterium]